MESDNRFSPPSKRDIFSVFDQILSTHEPVLVILWLLPYRNNLKLIWNKVVTTIHKQRRQVYLYMCKGNKWAFGLHWLHSKTPFVTDLDLKAKVKTELTTQQGWTGHRAHICLCFGQGIRTEYPRGYMQRRLINRSHVFLDESVPFFTLETGGNCLDFAVVDFFRGAVLYCCRLSFCWRSGTSTLLLGAVQGLGCRPTHGK